MNRFHPAIKASLAVMGLAMSVPVLGQTPLLEMAQRVRDQRGLEELVAASFGGGKIYEIKGAPFFVVDLMPTSGILSTELFVFESFKGQLILRAHVPREPDIVMKAEAQDGMLIVSENAHRGGEWRVRFQLFPIASASK